MRSMNICDDILPLLLAAAPQGDATCSSIELENVFSISMVSVIAFVCVVVHLWQGLMALWGIMRDMRITRRT